MRNLLSAASLSLTLPLVAACAHTPIVEVGTARPEGSTVALGEAVRVADVVLTPLRVVEDSRCPINARCIQAGRIVVETRVDGNGWRETAAMILGEPAGGARLYPQSCLRRTRADGRRSGGETGGLSLCI